MTNALAIGVWVTAGLTLPIAQMPAGTVVANAVPAQVLLAADTVEPQVLSIEWPDGVEIVAATNAGICAIAVSALLSGLWRPVGRPEPPLSASCSTGNAFAADAFCIHGFTCEKRGRNAR